VLCSSETFHIGLIFYGRDKKREDLDATAVLRHGMDRSFRAFEVVL
jgi:hypothetical protein